MAALLAYALPLRARRAGTLLAAVATVSGGALLVSLLPLVADGGRVESAAGSLVRGVPLTLRGDSTAVWVGLIACAACLLALSELDRSPLERTALLLCLGGTLVTCVAGNAVLLVAGLELGNAGALVLAAGAPPAPRGGAPRLARAGFAVQHLASLGMLGAAVVLLQGQGTSDLAALPTAALTLGVALPWGLCGLVRLGAAATLPEAPTGASPAWVAVAAVPSGLVVLLRLVGTAGGDLEAVAPTAAHVLTAVGLVVAAAGAMLALRSRWRPLACGRALCLSAAGQAGAMVGSGALGAAAAMGVALILAALAAPAWASTTAAGPRLRALALAVAGGVPCGAGATALLAGAGGEVAPGGIRAAVGAAAALIGVAAAVAGGAAAAAVLGDGRVARRRLPRPDVAAALAASGLLAVLPGVLLGGLADRVAGTGSAISALDASAVRGPGFAWAGGYLAVATLIAVVAALSVASIQDLPIGDLALAAPPAAPATGVARGPGATMALAEAAVEGVAPMAEGSRSPLTRLAAAATTAERWAVAVDRWLVRQPDVPLVIAAGAVVVIWFQYHP